MNNIQQQEKILTQAAAVMNKLHWKKGEYLVEYTRGRIYNKIGAYLKAINAFFKALFTAESLQKPYEQADCLQRIGDGYLMLKQYKLAADNYGRSLKIFSKLGKTINYVDCLNNLSLVYYYQKDYRRALDILEECKRNRKAVIGTIYEASYLSNISSCYRDMGILDSAIHYFDRTLGVYQMNDGKYNDLLAITLVEKARVHEMQNDLKGAIRTARQAYGMNNQFYGNNLYATELLSQLYLKAGDYKNAYKFEKEYFQAWENSQKQDRAKQIEALKFEYDNKQNAAQIASLNKDIAQKSLQRQILTGGLIFLAICLAGSILSFRVLQGKNKKIETQSRELSRISDELASMNATLEQQVEFRTVELTEANSELVRKNREIEEALYRGQNIERKRVASELHDNLGSTISGLIWQLDGLVMEGAQPEFQRIYHFLIDKMREAYSEIRNISHNLHPAELEKFGLIASLQRLVDSLNRNARINFSFNYNTYIDELPKQLQLELYAIVMELLNNVTKHSGAKASSVDLYHDSNTVRLAVSDDGIGLPADHAIDMGSGLRNIFARVSAIGGDIRVIKEGLFTRVLISVRDVSLVETKEIQNGNGSESISHLE